MSKNLNIKIKNTQLAELLRKNAKTKKVNKAKLARPDGQIKMPTKKAHSPPPPSKDTKEPDTVTEEPILHEEPVKIEAETVKSENLIEPALKTKEPKKEPAKKPLPTKDETPLKKEDKGKTKNYRKQILSEHAKKKGSFLDESRERSDFLGWRRRKSRRRTHEKPKEIIKPKEITIRLPILIKDLASALFVKSAQIISILFNVGLTLRVTDYIEDPAVIELIGDELNCVIIIDKTREKEFTAIKQTLNEDLANTDADLLKPRPPVITFMGHVDHGKTSIIDSIRQSTLAKGEAGSITQHIGAFSYKGKNGIITILDTPGHEAFEAVRERGATLTDLIILVISGTEGIKIQTEEAIKLAKKQKTPLLIAINKCDLEGFDQEQIYRELSDRDLLPEAWGGSTITINCSAKTNEGIPQLLEMVLLQTEMLELRANPEGTTRGHVIEAKLQKGLGASATILIQNGTLRINDTLLFKDTYARVKTIKNEFQQPLKEALPSSAITITGLQEVPKPGTEFIKVKNEKEAKRYTEQALAKSQRLALKDTKTDADQLFKASRHKKEKKTLYVLINADVQGSVDSILHSFKKIPQDKVQIKVIQTKLGVISQSDIELAHTSSAIILGFHTNLERYAEKLLKTLNVTIISENIIYHLTDTVKVHMLKLLDPLKQEREVSRAIIKTLFPVSHLGVIAGSQITEGTMKRTLYTKVLRNNEVIWEGKIASLKHLKEDVKEVKKGLECGILLEKFNDLQVDDQIVGFEIDLIKQDL